MTVPSAFPNAKSLELTIDNISTFKQASAYVSNIIGNEKRLYRLEFMKGPKGRFVIAEVDSSEFSELSEIIEEIDPDWA